METKKTNDGREYVIAHTAGVGFESKTHLVFIRNGKINFRPACGRKASWGHGIFDIAENDVPTCKRCQARLAGLV